MQRPAITLVVIWLGAGVAVGVMIGFLLWQSPAPAARADQSGAAEPASPSADAAGYEARIRTLENEKSLLTARLSDLSASNAALRAQMAEQRARPPRPARTPATAGSAGSLVSPGAPTGERRRATLDAAGDIAAAFVKEVGLAEGAKAELDAVLRKHRARLQQLELEHAQVKYASDNELTISVPAFADEGAKVRDALAADLGGRLQPEDLECLMQAVDGKAGSSTYNFGSAAREINIRMASFADGQRSFAIRETGTRSGASGREAAPDMQVTSITVGNRGGGLMAGTGPSSIETLSTSPDNGSYSRTYQSPVLPPQYSHFFPEEAFPGARK
jgi:hypothetical protein